MLLLKLLWVTLEKTGYWQHCSTVIWLNDVKEVKFCLFYSPNRILINYYCTLKNQITIVRIKVQLCSTKYFTALYSPKLCHPVGNIWLPVIFTVRLLFLSEYYLLSPIKIEKINNYCILHVIIVPFYNFSLDRILNPVVELLTSDYNKPKHIHTLESGHQICSLASTDKFLIVGTINEISGWNWKNAVSSKLSKPSWVIRIPSQSSSMEQTDVNSMWLSEDETKLYAGCGDNHIYAFNLEDGRLISTMKGHNDFIHSVHGKLVIYFYYLHAYVWSYCFFQKKLLPGDPQ